MKAQSPLPNASEDTDRLDLDTRLVARGEGTFELERPMTNDWFVMKGPNGGFVAALMLRAMQQWVDDAARIPRSLTVHYTSPPTEGPAEIETATLRSGRSLSSVTARLTQEGKLRAFAVAALSSARSGPEFADLHRPECPPVGDLAPYDAFLPIHKQYDIRFLPGSGRGADADHAMTAGWIRLAGRGRVADAQLLAAYADALPPPVFALKPEVGVFGPLPTVDLTVHFRNPEAWAEVGPADHCLAIFRSRLSEGGFVEEDGEIWSPSGRLLAHSRQLAIALT
jgi:acyl-CoA thioesterase